MQIIPMRDLKNTVEVERRCAEENGPVYVTKNGYGRLVVMDIAYYERTMQKMYEAKALMEAMQDLKSGRVVDGDAAFAALKEKYGLLVSVFFAAKSSGGFGKFGFLYRGQSVQPAGSGGFPSESAECDSGSLPLP